MESTLVRFRDSAGVQWNVWEVGQRLAHAAAGVTTGEYPRLQTAGWLCFESERERRRLSMYPYKWFKLPSVELEELCRNATARPDVKTELQEMRRDARERR